LINKVNIQNDSKGIMKFHAIKKKNIYEP